MRRLVVSGLAVMGMLGGTQAYANSALDSCHPPTLASLPVPATEVSNMFDLNKAGLASRLSDEKMMFTRRGYQTYLNVLRRSGYLAAVQRGMNISAEADGVFTLSGSCSAPAVRIPVRFTYTDAQGTRHRQNTVDLLFHVGGAFPMPKIAQIVVIPPLKLSHGTE
ncbi:hypothetical protein NR402_07305 [Acidithiobacillus ferrooxidans]|uniref:hypothetical protein n=1 Tax=Acidithiobacillus ferrooxidans TaxID=920 RepID=UPI00214C6EBE|nr:hypothetical protein [Acidithiobacillus ferrooxidans]MCR2830087.1 hypothetical protein [Acidithiobacillus ferrooxidans]